MTARIEALDAVRAACWHELGLAARTRSHGWRRLALATLAPPAHAGEPPLPEVRTVVLRELLADEQLLVFYSDSRAPKLAQLRAQPRASAMLWCPTLGWQLRLRLQCAVDTGGLGVSSRWARLKMHPAAQDYLSPLPPGTALSQPTPAPDRASREHFAVVFARVEAMDWLELHADGHRRAQFDASGAGRWVTP